MPINPNVPIQTKGGLEANVQGHQAKVRELMISTDTNNLYVGKGTGNSSVLVADSTVPNRVQALENQANTIFTSNSDTFADTSKIGTETNLVVANGVIRPTITYYQENMRNYPYIDEPLTDGVITSNSSGTSSAVLTLDTGYIPARYSTGTQFNSYRFATENIFYVENASEIRVTPTFSNWTPSSTKGFGSPKVIRILQNINLIQEPIYNALKDSDNNIWHFNFYIGTPAYGGNLVNSHLYVQKNEETVVPMFQNGTYQTIQSDTSRRNLSITETPTQIIVAYPISTTQYGIRYVNKDGSPDTTVHTINMTTTSIILHSVEILWHDSQLHVLVSNQNGATNRSIVYAKSSTLGNFVIPDNDYFIRYPSIFTYSLKLLPTASNRITWMGFSNQSTVAVHYGIIDTASTTFPHQIRTSPVAVTSGTVYPYRATGCVTLTSSCNGQGTATYDPNTNFVYGMWGRSGNADTQFVRIPLGASDTVPTVTTITTAPFDTFQNRDSDIMVDNTTTSFPLTLRCLWTGTSRFRLYTGTVNCSATGVFTMSTTQELYRNEGSFNNFPVSACKLIKRNDYTTTGEFDIYMVDANQSILYKLRYDNDIQPELFCQLAASNGGGMATPNFNQSSTNLASLTTNQVYSNQSKTFTFTTPYTGFFRLDFRYFYPVNHDGNGFVERTVVLTDVTVERSVPTSTTGGSGEFISVPLITDRIVKKALLQATQSVGSTVGNDIEWYIQAIDNGTWYPISNGAEVEFNSSDYGSQLRTKAVLTWGSGTSSLATVPYIDGYTVSSTNIVTASDLEPIQVNMLKMGLRLQALTNYTTTSFVKMMIDTFLDTSNIDASTTAVYNSTNQWYSATANNQEVVSKVETTTGDGVTSVVSAIVMAEYTGTINFFIRRGTGAWLPVTLGDTFAFSSTSGSPANQIQIKAVMSSGAVLYGFAYLYQ
jgi:hypothetical protein